MKTFSLVLFFLLFLKTPYLFSQSDISRPFFELGVMTGPWLPSNYGKLTEIVSLTGVRGGYYWGDFHHEVTYLAGKGKGLEVNLVTWALRNDVDFIKELNLFWVGGLHYIKYRPKYPNLDNILPIETASGWFFGFGVLIKEKKLSFRTDFNLAMKPGRHLYVGLGFLFAFPGDSQGGE